MARAAAIECESLSDAAQGTSTEDEVIERLEAKRVATAIGALPDEQRRVLIPGDVYGAAASTSPTVSDSSVAAMKSHLRRA